MSKVSPLINDFSAGEFGPLASARVDFERYRKSMETCLNWVPTLQGGLIPRPGTKYVANVDDLLKPTKLTSMVFAKDDAFILVFNNNAIRFYKNNAEVQVSGSPYEVAHSYDDADIQDLSFCQSNSALYIFHENYPPAKLIRVSDTNWVLADLDLRDGPYLDQISPLSDYSNSVKANHGLYTTAGSGTSQNVNVQNTRVVTGTNNVNGEIEIVMSGGHYFKDFDRVIGTGILGTTNANSDFICKVTSSTTILLKGSVYNAAWVGGGTQRVRCAYFETTDVGRWLRIKDVSTGGLWGVTKIVSVTDKYTVNVDWYSDIVNFPQTQWPWRLGAYSETTGYPSGGCFHDNRLWMVGPGPFVAASKVGDYENFAPSDTDTAGTVSADNGITINLSSQVSGNAKWIVSDEKGLIVGTDEGEWLIKSASSTEAISPLSLDVKEVTNWGSNNVQPVKSGKATIFTNVASRQVREFNYFYDVEGYRCVDLTELAHHIGKTGITQMCLQRQPYNLVWCVRDDGKLACLTYQRDIDGLKVAWHRHEIAGIKDTAGQKCEVLSIASIPSSDGTYDELWLAVKRQMNGTDDHTTLEYMTKFFDQETEQEDAFFLDCGGTYDSPITITDITQANPGVVTATAHGLNDGEQIRFDEIVGMEDLNGNNYYVDNKTANTFEIVDENGNAVDTTTFGAYYSGGEVRKLVTSISGLTHLNGQTISLLGDGAVLDDVEVSGGVAQLSEPSAVVQYGLLYYSDGKLPRLEAGSQDGTALGKTKRTHRLGFMLERSLGLKVGQSFDDDDMNDLTDLIQSEVEEQQFNQAPALFTGIASDTSPFNSDMNNQICFRRYLPLPCTILAIMPQMVTQDR